MATIINHEIRTGLAIWRYAERTVEDVRGMIATRLAAGHGVLIAEGAEGVLGWASYGPFRAGEGYDRTVEHSVHIVPAAQRRGLGLAFDGTAARPCKGERATCRVAAIDSTLDASIALHRKLGFEEIGRLPQVGWKFDRWLTLVLMQKIL